ncbi:hypothetical protein Cassandra_0366 [Pseudomonas phage Cassandra]|nr:hypothetical protein Cassandra_0366 [Pseudomonas phage Cassandra]WPK39558.1 hypothetical protein Deiofobo_0361 [Pseudomonas phage Deifobo]
MHCNIKCEYECAICICICMYIRINVLRNTIYFILYNYL